MLQIENKEKPETDAAIPSVAAHLAVANPRKKKFSLLLKLLQHSITEFLSRIACEIFHFYSRLLSPASKHFNSLSLATILAKFL